MFIYCLEIAMAMDTRFEGNSVTTIDYGKNMPMQRRRGAYMGHCKGII